MATDHVARHCQDTTASLPLFQQQQLKFDRIQDIVRVAKRSRFQQRPENPGGSLQVQLRLTFLTQGPTHSTAIRQRDAEVALVGQIVGLASAEILAESTNPSARDRPPGPWAGRLSSTNARPAATVGGDES